MLKKYHLCDLFTLLEIILACTLIAMAHLQISANYAIWVFIGGELCDALDGPCARCWPYPDDGKKRFWRIPWVVKAAEHISDITLISALAFYLLKQKGLFFQITICGTAAILTFSLIIEYTLFTRPYSGDERRRLILMRRYVYLLGIAVGIGELVFCTTWTLLLKIGSCILGLIIGFFLIIAKWDRFTESDEPFYEFLRRMFKVNDKP